MHGVGSERESLPAADHLGVLVAEFLLHCRRDALVDFSWAQSLADRQQRVHAVCRLVDLLVESKSAAAPLVLRRAH